MPRKDKLGFYDHKGGLKRLTRNTAEAGRDVTQSVAKELLLLGLYGIQELTGADPHNKPLAGKRPWEKKWGER